MTSKNCFSVFIVDLRLLLSSRHKADRLFLQIRSKYTQSTENVAKLLNSDLFHVLQSNFREGVYQVNNTYL